MFVPRSTSRAERLKQLPVNGVELRRTVSPYGVTVPGGRIGGAQDVPYGRLEWGFGLACASQRCNHVLNGHALAIVRIDKARCDASVEHELKTGE